MMRTDPRPPSILPTLVIVAIGALVPLVLASEFHLRLAMVSWSYAILCMGFNLLYGYTGQISLAQQAFFAIGAYAFVMLETSLHWPPVAALVAGIALCSALALVIGVPLLRLRTHYLAMATLAFALVCYGIENRWIDFTGGQTGLAVPPLAFQGHRIGSVGIYYIVLLFAALVLLLHDFIIRSHLGRALQAIRDDETAASALGAHVTRYKLRIFVLAAAMAAVGGFCFSIISLRVDPSMGEFQILVTILTVTVVGGLGTRYGPVVGALVVTVLPQFLASFGEMETLVYGIAVLIFLLFLPNGLSGLLERFARQRLRARHLAANREAGA